MRVRAPEARTATVAPRARPDLALALRVEAGGPSTGPTVAALIPWNRVPWLQRLCYALPASALRRYKVASLERGVLVRASDVLEGIPFGTLFELAAPDVLVPVGTRLTPAVSPALLVERLGATERQHRRVSRSHERAVSRSRRDHGSARAARGRGADAGDRRSGRRTACATNRSPSRSRSRTARWDRCRCGACAGPRRRADERSHASLRVGFPAADRPGRPRARRAPARPRAPSGACCGIRCPIADAVDAGRSGGLPGRERASRSRPWPSRRRSTRPDDAARRGAARSAGARAPGAGRARDRGAPIASPRRRWSSRRSGRRRPCARPSTGIRCWRACPRSCASIAPSISGWGARPSWDGGRRRA